MTMTNGGGTTPRATTGIGATTPPVPPVPPTGTTSPTTTQDKAAQAKDAAAQGARQVAHQTSRQTKELARDAMGEVRTVVDRARGEAVGHADTQATKAAGGMRMLSEQLRALAEGRPEQAGRAGQFARDAIEPLQRWAESLEQGGVNGLSEEAARLARRRPGMFLAACAGLGFVSGRLVKATRAVSHDGTNGSIGPNGTPGLPTVTGYPAMAPAAPIDAPSGVYAATAGGAANAAYVPPTDPAYVSPTDLGATEQLFEADVDPSFAPDRATGSATDVPPARGTRGR